MALLRWQIVGIALALAVATALPIGCGKQEADSNKGVIWMIPSHRAHPVWLVGRNGFEKACREMGYTPKWNAAENAELDVNIGYVEQAIAERAAGILVFPYNDVAYTQVINKAAEAGIPVVTIHWDAPASKRKAFIGPDPEVYAVAAADRLGELLGGKGNVGIMQGNFNPLENKVARIFTGRLARKYPAIKVVAHDEDTTETVKATEKAINMIQTHPELNGVFSSTGGGAVSWSKAMEETGTLGRIYVISMDVTRQNLDLVKAGKIYGVIAQGIYDEGYQGVKLLLQDSPKPINYTDNTIITKDLADPYYSQCGGK
ncbi:MAG TPA: substrate-binding domain-containing protein [Phycisphaerae bacterium]|nr:substrate-binding domain-containing protein [Phycisphaerae bacterium]